MVKSRNVYPEMEMSIRATIISVNPATSVALGGINTLVEPAPDFVIVYKYKHEKQCLQLFYNKLEQDYGLLINKLPSSDFLKDGVMFAAISAPRTVLAKRAKELELVFPLNLCVNDASNSTLWGRIKHIFSPTLESGFFKIPYNENSGHYITSLAFEDGDPFSSSRIRGMLINDIIKDVDISEELKRSNPENKDFAKDEYHGLRWLEEHGYIKDSFPLHSKVETRALSKLVLSKSSWVKSLSITSLRNYFGEKIGFSFAWRSAWLSNALGVPLFFGLITMIYGLATGKSESVKPPLYYEAGNKSLGGVEENYVYAMNNPATPYYALIMCIWVTLFSKIWARFKFIYAFKWGTINFFLTKERENVKFTYVSERSSPKKIVIWCFSLFCTLLSLLFGVVYCLVMIYAQTALTLYVADWIDAGTADGLVNVFVSLVNTLLVTFLVNPIFEWTSMKLTELERHHFDSDFERALTKKVFFNTFFNNNIRILMMLVTPRFDLYNVFSRKTDNFVFCKQGLCSEAISYQILFFLLLRPFTGLLKYFWYTLRRMVQRRCLNKAGLEGGQTVDSTLVSSIERQYKLYSGQRFGEKFTTMDDMNVRVAQYGFVVMFAAAFPFAPFIAFIVEVLMRRADIDRYLKRQRRPMPRQHEGIGSWQDIVEFVNMAAICTNVWIIAFRSIYGLDMLIDWQKYFEHDYKAMQSVILMSGLVLLTSGIRAVSQYSTIPEKVKIMQRREEQTAKEFLESRN